MSHVVKTIIAEIQIEQVNAGEVVIFFKLMNGQTEEHQKFFIVIFPHCRRERKDHTDRLRAVVETKFYIITQDTEIFRDGFGIKFLRQIFQLVFPINNGIGGNFTVERNFCAVEI